MLLTKTALISMLCNYFFKKNFIHGPVLTMSRHVTIYRKLGEHVVSMLYVGQWANALVDHTTQDTRLHLITLGHYMWVIGFTMYVFNDVGIIIKICKKLLQDWKCIGISAAFYYHWCFLLYNVMECIIQLIIVILNSLSFLSSTINIILNFNTVKANTYLNILSCHKVINYSLSQKHH